MTILVTGSSGFIGSNLIKTLDKKKINFIGIDKIKNPYFKIKNFYKIDLLNQKKLEEIILKKKIKHVIHLAAIPGFVNCHNSPSDAFKNNIEATFNLLMACKKNNVQNILLASSMGVDNFLTNPSIYGLTKFVCEKFSRTFNVNFKMNIKICKFSNVFGPYSSHKTSAVHTFMKKILSNQKIRIHKSGTQERDFIFVEDVCKKLISNISNKTTAKEININTNKYLRIIDIVHILNKISKKNNKYTYVKTPQGYDDKVYKKPIMKIRKNIIKKLEITFNWYKNRGKKNENTNSWW